jgi:hypothetical protein
MPSGQLYVHFLFITRSYFTELPVNLLKTVLNLARPQTNPAEPVGGSRTM